MGAEAEAFSLAAFGSFDFTMVDGGAPTRELARRGAGSWEHTGNLPICPAGSRHGGRAQLLLGAPPVIGFLSGKSGGTAMKTIAGSALVLGAFVCLSASAAVGAMAIR